MRGDAFRVKSRESFQHLFTASPGRSVEPVNAGNISPEHPVAPYPSNAAVRPETFYNESGGSLGTAHAPGIGMTTTALLPPHGTTIDNPPSIWTSIGLEQGVPPIRVPRLYPNREPAGVRFAMMTNSMGLPNGDLYFVPLPAIPKTTAIPSRVRAGYPQLSDDQLIPAVYVGGDA